MILEKNETGWYARLLICNGLQEYWEEFKLEINGRYSAVLARQDLQVLLGKKANNTQFRIAKAELIWKEEILILN